MTEAKASGRSDGGGNALAVLVLLLTLVLPSLTGLVTPYLLAICGLLLAIHAGIRGELWDAFKHPTARLFALAFFLLLACYIITAQTPRDVVLVFNFGMIVLFAPIRSGLERRAAPGNTLRVAKLAALGTLLALGATLVRLYVFNEARADDPILGAIVLANTAVILGFIAAMGAMVAGPGNWVYLIFPFISVLVVGLTGSRGPMIAILPLIILTTLFLIRRYNLPTWAGIAGGLITSAACGAIFWLVGGRATSVLTAVAAATSGKADVAALDNSTSIRLDFYRAGLRAFVEQPIFGHGWARLMAAVEPFLPADKSPYQGLPQLHNDVVNFAVAAGVVGIGIYLLLLAAPLRGTVRSRRDRQFPARLYGSLVLVIAYICDGLTDLMFGFEFHTAFYICVAAILTGYCLDGHEDGMR